MRTTIGSFSVLESLIQPYLAFVSLENQRMIGKNLRGAPIVASRSNGQKFNAQEPPIEKLRS